MKEKIHPDYKKAIVSCACGNTFETRSTVGDIKLEVCSSCHTFYSGVSRFMDTDGRVEKYKKRAGKALPKKEKEK